jgi:hypothetical protein
MLYSYLVDYDYLVYYDYLVDQLIILLANLLILLSFFLFIYFYFARLSAGNVFSSKFIALVFAFEIPLDFTPILPLIGSIPSFRQNSHVNVSKNRSLIDCTNRTRGEKTSKMTRIFKIMENRGYRGDTGYLAGGLNLNFGFVLNLK